MLVLETKNVFCGVLIRELFLNLHILFNNSVMRWPHANWTINSQVVANTELLFNEHWTSNNQESPLFNNHNSIRKYLSFIQMVSCEQ